MNKFLFLFGIFFLVFSCKKTKHEKAYTITDKKSLEKLFQLKNYKNQEKIKINDSTIHIKADNGRFFLEGNMNSKLNERTGIWSLTNKTNLQKIEIDYIAFGKKDVHRNQILFFNDKGILDSLTSKFYISEIKNDKNKKYLELKFFSTRNPKERFAKASVHYSIIRDHKEIMIDSISLKDGNGRYKTKVDFDFKPKDRISGYFSEFTTSQIEDDSRKIGDSVTIAIGNSTIYFREKL